MDYWTLENEVVEMNEGLAKDVKTHKMKVVVGWARINSIVILE